MQQFLASGFPYGAEETVEEYLVKLEAYYNIGETINIDKTCKNITNASNNEPLSRHSLIVYNTFLQLLGTKDCTNINKTGHFANFQGYR